MVEKSQDKEMDKSVAVGNVENNSEKHYFEAEATPKPQKMFFSVFPTEGTWGKTQNQRSTFFLQRCQEKKSEQYTVPAPIDGALEKEPLSINGRKN